MGIEFWKKKAATTPATTTWTSRPQPEELRQAFGDKGAALLSAELERSLIVRRQGPFFWADLATSQHGSGWLLVDGRVARLGVATVLPTLLAQSITEPMDVTARVATACAVARVVVVHSVEELDRLTDRWPGWRTTRDRFEPPHGEGSRWVCCVADEDRGNFVEASAHLYRLTIDADTLRVDLEQLGEIRHDALSIRGPAHVDDSGVAVVAEFDADAFSPWIEPALTEHAGVAAFARLTLELLAVGAPLDLIGRVQQAALDEVRHAEQCLSLAKNDGVDVVFGALPALSPRPGTRADIARRVHDELVVHEEEAVRDLRARAGVCVDDDVRAILSQQADDEARHVQLARDIIAWALNETG